jgi:hypothetical protein
MKTDQNWSNEEWAYANKMASFGYDVIANRRTGDPTFDFYVTSRDGRNTHKVELKTPQSLKTDTILGYKEGIQ